MLRILVLIISDDSDPTYSLDRTVWKKYMKIHPSIDSYFITLRDEPDTNYPYIDSDTVYFKGEEAYKNIILKTMYALEFFKDKNYDYIVRTNLSSLWNYFELYNHIQTLPRTGVYHGIKYRSVETTHPFISGAGMIFSKDTADRLIGLKNDVLSINVIDDVDIGVVLSKAGVELTSGRRTDFCSLDAYDESKIKGSYHFRLKCRNRNEEYNLMNMVYNAVYNIQNTIDTSLYDYFNINTQLNFVNPIITKNVENDTGNQVDNNLLFSDIFKEVTSIYEKTNDFARIKRIITIFNPLQLPYENRHYFLIIAFLTEYYTNNYNMCQHWLSFHEFTEIPPLVYSNCKFLFEKLGKKIVGTSNPVREPNSQELVIVYGNYPDWFKALPYCNKVYRNVSLISDVNHTQFEFHPCWRHIDQIYVINMEHRPDRLNDIMAELCRVQAPLDKIHLTNAKKTESPYLSCTENHVNVISHFSLNNFKNCLVIEDDAVFIEREVVWQNLETFFNRQYDFNVCHLAISKYRKREPYDDLLSETKQSCTGAVSYILSGKTVGNVLSCVKEGFEKLKADPSTQNDTAIDCYWKNLDKRFYFKTKLAFNRPNMSSLTGNINFNLD